MRYRARSLSLAALASSALVIASAAPISSGPFGSQPAFAKGGSNGNGGGGGNAGSNANPSGNAPGQNKQGNQPSLTSSPAQGLKPASAGTPNAVVRQYVIANGLSQGDVAKVLKSWNSLNRDARAYLATMGNLKSLPGLQYAYISANMAAQDALAAFETLGGDAQNPPTEADSLAAQTVVDQYQAWVAYQNADPTDPDTQAALLAAFEALGGDPLNPPLEADALAAQTVVDQYNAWTTYLDAEAGAADAFLAASVSYKNANLDETALAELRALVDAIVAAKDLAN